MSNVRPAAARHTQIPTATQLLAALSKATPLYIVLAGPHLPSLIPLASTTPAFEHRLTNGTPHKLNGSHKARHRIFIGDRQ